MLDTDFKMAMSE